MGQAAEAPARNPVHCVQRCPEKTTLYKLAQEHLEVELGANLPDFVKDEVDAVLECGILAHGFLCLRFTQGAYEKRVAFSSKRRGLSPYSGARR